MTAFDPVTSHPPFTMPVTQISGQNSLEFIRAVFDHYESGRVFAITKPGVALPLPNDDGDVLDLRIDTATTGWGRLAHQPDTTDTPAQITLTSGTEGAPKPILLSHRNLADAVARLNDVMQVTPEIREYIGIPVQYSFGLGRVRAVSAAGGAFFLPRAFDPAEIRRMLDADAINAISAVPSLWRLVLGAPEIIGDAGRKVRWIEIGSQYMSGDEKAAMIRLFPQARIVQHYGMTEASRTTFLVLSDVDPRYLDTVGKPTGSAEVAVSEAGVIRIRGPHVAMGMITPDRTLKPLTNADGWLQTGDRGEIHDGYLSYKGRIDDQINIAGVKINAEAIEAAITALLPSAAGQFAIVNSPDPLRGEIALLVTEADADPIVPVILAAAAQAFEIRGIPAAGALRSTRVTTLPRTDTGKIARVKLRDIPPPAAGAHAPQHERKALSAAQTTVADTWHCVVGDMQIGPDDTFYDIGGDSLSALQIALTMERQNFTQAAIRATFEGRSLAEVAQANAADTATAQAEPATPLADQTQRTWALTLARAFAVLAVLLSHWGEGFFNRLGGARWRTNTFRCFTGLAPQVLPPFSG
ncbi:class I adenylate-forming enzyme family protein [Yoonia sp.]|uniref:class I adenylate-forming enzyme family protein n=1 Tax=Yoonia sp. TaxID=2212373 RepID=UPI0019FC4947|nr:AMP-binding protein [Yoonia sp.]MBE0414853.1 AMP-binding protein [Yoonia sp.]